MKEGYKKTELGWIPEEWKIKKVSELCTVKGGKRLPKGYQLLDEPNGNPYIRVADMYSGGVSLDDIKYVPDEIKDSIKNYTISDKDLFISVAGTLGVVGMIPKELDGANLTENADKLCDIKINTNFFMRVLQSNIIQRIIESEKTNNAQPKLALTRIKEFLIPVPNDIEQQKITDILEAVDSQIDDTDKLIERTKELKKGLMQRLLTKGIGHSEFKKSEVGEIPVEWTVERLIDISNGKGEYGIGASATTYIEGKPRYLRITDIGDSCDLLNEDIKGLEEETYANYLLKENDVVFARTGNTTGKSYVYKRDDGLLVFAGFLIKFSINEHKCDVNFLKYIIQSKRYWDWIKVMSTRSGQPGINSTEYANFKVQLPNIIEQKQISDILSSVDNQILKYENKKIKLEELKKGLMQQLLTGKIRVV